MDTEQQRRWREADAALDRLLDLPPEQRGAALAALSEDIRQLTAQLLAAHERQGVLDQALPPLSGSPTAEAMLNLPGVPGRIGAWILGEVLGRGGMSIVYSARRELPAGTQHAAMKLLTVAALAADGRRRFLREHQVLARLTHPRIAALLDAGVLEDGTPYLAMQRVDGERIDAWCREQALHPRAIVTLFLQVCDTVAYAHRQLVVHRDLKPGNILVDREGTVRLLDFGIARLLDDSVDAESTRTEFRALTPQYAAPEQFSGEDSGTAADVFGLGAVLYHLLTGRPPRLPQQGHDTQITQPSRAVQSTEALPPPARALFSRVLKGDLDAVLLKALQADPVDRYPDATRLAEDLRRWLEERPVSAARAGRRYRARKFIARHRGGVAASLLIAAAVLAGVVGTLWQARRAELAAAEALQEAQRATRVKEFLLELFGASDLERADGRTLDARELLALGATRAKSGEGLGRDTRVELLTVIAMSQRSLAEHEAAADALAHALALAEDPATPRHLKGEILHQQGTLAKLESRFDEALVHYGAALDVVGDSTDPALQDLRGRILIQRGGALTSLERLAEARADLDAAGTLLAARPATPVEQRALLEGNRAILEYTEGRHAEAYEFLKRELVLQRSLGQATNPRMADTLSNLSAVAAMVGRLEEGLEYDRQSVELARALYPEGHPRIGNSLYGLGDTQRLVGRYDDSVATLTQAVEILSRGDRPQPAAMAEMALGRTHLARGDYDTARTLSERLVGLTDGIYGETSTATLRSVAMLGEALQYAGTRVERDAWSRDAARRLAEGSEEIRWHPNAQDLRWRLAVVASADGDAAGARRWLDEAAQAPLPDGTPPAATLRQRALSVELWQRAQDPQALDAARTLAADLRAAGSRSRETRAYAWSKVLLAARGQDPALEEEARTTLEGLLEGAPLPDDDGRAVRAALQAA